MSKVYEAHLPQELEIQAKIESTLTNIPEVNWFNLEEDIAYDYDYLVSFKNEQSIHETYKQIKKNIPETEVKILPDQIEDLVKDNEELVVDFYFDIKENMEGEKMENDMQKDMEQLQAMNQEVMNLQTAYCEKKFEVKELDAKLYLFGEEEVKKALGKEKVTQKDKEYFATLQTLKLQKEADIAYMEYKYSQENFKLKKMEFRAKYPAVEI